jgi:hypothetical protein
MNKTLRSICIALLLLPAAIFAQQQPAEISFQVTVRVAPRQPAPPLQSFAYGTFSNLWLLIGGRTNGFHRTSTREATFPTAESNEDIYVVDVQNARAWKAPIPPKFLNQLRSTNMEHYQDGNMLYLVGGYGSTCNDDKPTCYQTFPNLTAISVSNVVKAIIARQDFTQYITSLTDERMRVTGGELLKIGDNFYLVFGQDFEGIYKGGITGKYTEQVRRFKINLSGGNLSISDYKEFKDPKGSGVESQYHRRDLNVVEALRPNRSLGLIAYGGVFTKTAGAWTNPIEIDESGGNTNIKVDTSFDQKMSQYTCAHLLMYSASKYTMFTTLFGGISFYYYDKNGKLVESNTDNFMPFIKSITTLARLSSGRTVEWPQPPSLALPERVGANGIFVPASTAPKEFHDILDLDSLPQGQTLVGYLYGGIHALDDQVNFINPSYADSTIYEVYVTK